MITQHHFGLMAHVFRLLFLAQSEHDDDVVDIPIVPLIDAIKSF